MEKCWAQRYVTISIWSIMACAIAFILWPLYRQSCYGLTTYVKETAWCQAQILEYATLIIYVFSSIALYTLAQLRV